MRWTRARTWRTSQTLDNEDRFVGMIGEKGLRVIMSPPRLTQDSVADGETCDFDMTSSETSIGTGRPSFSFA
ncbi:MAG: hypothetical protein CMJ46_04260 [Planctomyces sp.]|nr:hypothetical protein [Planctomyces sp.]